MSLEEEIQHNLTLKQSRFSKLNYYLNYQLPTVVLFIFVLFYPLAVMVLFAAACIFSFYMLYILLREKKYGWVTTFFLMILLPSAASYLFLPSFFYYITIGLFYTYCFLLKLTVRDWVAAENARFELEQMRRMKKLKEEAENYIFRN